MAYATTAQLAAYTGIAEGSLPSNADLMLDRASELLDDVIVATYTTTDSDVQDALQDAACAQVEFWLEVGEEHDITGQRGEVEIERMRIARLPGTLAPRARRHLASENLLSRAVEAT